MARNKYYEYRRKMVNDEYRPISEELEEVTKEVSVIKEEPEKPITKGCKVIFTGNKSYSGLNLNNYTGGTYYAKDISGNRVVIAKGSEVVAAVNIKDCKRI